MLKKLIICGLLCGLLLCVAQPAVAGWSASGVVTKLQLGSTGNLFITTSATPINPAGCPYATYFLSSTFSAFNRYYAMLMSARASGDGVRIYINDTTCNAGYPLIQGAIQED